MHRRNGRGCPPGNQSTSGLDSTARTGGCIQKRGESAGLDLANEADTNPKNGLTAEKQAWNDLSRNVK